MKYKLLAICLCLLLILGGCAASRYGNAEKYMKEGRYNKAIRGYLRLLEPHMRDGKHYIYYDKEAVTGIGVSYWYLEKYKTAVKILQMVVDKDPYYGKAVFYLGMSYEGAGREEEAINVYRKYPHIAPGDPYRQVCVGRVNWLVRRKVLRDVQQALREEEMLKPTHYPEKSIAVLYFISLSEDPQWKPLQRGFAEMIITDLSKIEELHVIERLRLNALMDELSLSESGLFDENASPRLGKLMGARNLLKGSYMIMPDLRMTVDAGIFHAEDISLPADISFDGNLSRLFRIEKELVLRIIDHFGIQLSPQQREEILVIPTENMVAFMSYCQGLEALDDGDYSLARKYFMESLRYDPNFIMAQDYFMEPDIWAATQNSNLIRVDREISQFIKTTPKGRVRLAYKPSPPLISPISRLSRMGLYQNACFLPGNDSRESFQEARLSGAPVVPEILGTPPLPPGVE